MHWRRHLLLANNRKIVMSDVTDMWKTPGFAKNKELRDVPALLIADIYSPCHPRPFLQNDTTQ